MQNRDEPNIERTQTKCRKSLKTPSIFWVSCRLQGLLKRRGHLYIRILDYCNIPDHKIAMRQIKVSHIKARKFPKFASETACMANDHKAPESVDTV
jgi:hypothetical protein